MTMTIDPEDEKLVDELIEEAIKGYERVIPSRELEAMRACLRHEYLVNPEGRRKLRALRPDPEVDRSGDMRKESSAHAGDAPKTRSKK